MKQKREKKERKREKKKKKFWLDRRRRERENRGQNETVARRPGSQASIGCLRMRYGPCGLR